MGKLKEFSLGIIFGIIVVGCATGTFKPTFPFHWYGLDLVSYQGKLLGPIPAQDKDFTNCQPDQNNRGKCVVMPTAEFFALKTDYENYQIQLNSCQKSAKMAKPE